MDDAFFHRVPPTSLLAVSEPAGLGTQHCTNSSCSNCVWLKDCRSFRVEDLEVRQHAEESLLDGLPLPTGRVCSVVATVGLPAATMLGREIDDADVVIRIGEQAKLGYESHVGTRTDYRVRSWSESRSAFWAAQRRSGHELTALWCPLGAVGRGCWKWFDGIWARRVVRLSPSLVHAALGQAGGAAEHHNKAVAIQLAAHVCTTVNVYEQQQQQQNLLSASHGVIPWPLDQFAFSRWEMSSRPMPNLLSAFDIVIHARHRCKPLTRPDASPRNPRSVFLHTEASACYDAFEALLTSLPTNSSCVLAMGLSDKPLSRLKHRVQRWIASGAFAHIDYEAMDIALEPVRPLITTLTDRYVLPSPDITTALIRQLNSPAIKTGGVIASWGTYNPRLNLRLGSRKDAQGWVGQHADQWWLKTRTVSPIDYWGYLAQHRFILYPTGAGVQSPKAYEALLVGVIPICLSSVPAFRQLAKEGWPFVTVQGWYQRLTQCPALLCINAQCTK